MTDLTQDEIISRVSSIFDVKETIINIDDIQFEIEDKNFKDKFVNLARQLEVRNFAPRLEKSSGGIDITGYSGLIRIDTEGSSPSDELETITGGKAGMVIMIRTVLDSRDVVIKNGTGNIVLAWTDDDVTLDARTKPLTLVYSESVSRWLEAK